jgi:hypothetical protein
MKQKARFTSIIYKIGINPVVDPPDQILDIIFDQVGRSKGPIPVRGRLNNTAFVQTLVKYRGAWRLYINGLMLKDSGTTIGDTVQIEIEFDPRPRDVPVPDELRSALDRDENARSVFEALSPSRQKEIFRYIGSLKSAESVNRNVERVLKHLHGEKTDGLHALMRRDKTD